MTPLRYPTALRVLHWSIAVLILAALIMGTFVMARIEATDPAKASALLKHMLVGLLILSLTLLRLFLRPRSRRPAPMLSGIAIADRIADRAWAPAAAVIAGRGIDLEVALFDRAGHFLASTGFRPT